MHARTLARTNDARMYMHTLPRARKRARETATKTDGDASTTGGMEVRTHARTHTNARMHKRRTNARSQLAGA